MKQPLRTAIVPIDNKGVATIEFSDLMNGVYAVSAYYDANSDGKLDTGFLGIPRELVAFSNNARGRFGPASFRKSSFQVTGNTEIQFRFGKAKK